MFHESSHVRCAGTPLKAMHPRNTFESLRIYSDKMENSPRKLEIFESSASGFNYDGEAGKYAADREPGGISG
jgi:hypothetical protein